MARQPAPPACCLPACLPACLPSCLPAGLPAACSLLLFAPAPCPNGQVVDGFWQEEGMPGYYSGSDQVRTSLRREAGGALSPAAACLEGGRLHPGRAAPVALAAACLPACLPATTPVRPRQCCWLAGWLRGGLGGCCGGCQAGELACRHCALQHNALVPCLLAPLPNPRQTRARHLLPARLLQELDGDSEEDEAAHALGGGEVRRQRGLQGRSSDAGIRVGGAFAARMAAPPLHGSDASPPSPDPLPPRPTCWRRPTWRARRAPTRLPTRWSHR